MTQHGPVGLHNQAMEPVGTQELAPAKPAVREVPRGITGGELARGLLWTVVFILFLGVIACVLAAIPWALQALGGALGGDTGRLWGQSIGNILSIVLVFVMIFGTLLTIADRKWGGLIQDRPGPNRARLPIPGLKNSSFGGIPHLIADVVKMLTKEEVVPAMSSKFIFNLAPALAFAPPLALFAVVPMSPAFPLFGETIRLQVADIDMGLLWVFAIASIAVLGTSLAGWASNNKFALLGGMRASAQMISYEVTLGLTLVGLMITFGTLRLDEMTQAQGTHLWGWLPAWGVFFQPLAIIAYFAAASAEIKRPPFDLPEGESEIVGYFIEYSGLKFGLFMISEYVEVVIFAGLFTALFFGGYHLPWGEGWIREAWGPTALGLIQTWAFVAKTVFFAWFSLVVRWTFPRFRYDQVMNLGWKILLPLSLVNVMLTAALLLIGGRELVAVVGLLQLAAVVLFVIGGFHIHRQGDETALEPAVAEPAHAGHGAHH